jgi:hypothetical protein
MKYGWRLQRTTKEKLAAEATDAEQSYKYEASLAGHRATEFTENYGFLRGTALAFPTVLVPFQKIKRFSGFLGGLGGSVSS